MTNDDPFDGALSAQSNDAAHDWTDDELDAGYRRVLDALENIGTRDAAAAEVFAARTVEGHDAYARGLDCLHRGALTEAADWLATAAGLGVEDAAARLDDVRELQRAVGEPMPSAAPDPPRDPPATADPADERLDDTRPVPGYGSGRPGQSRSFAPRRPHRWRLRWKGWRDGRYGGEATVLAARGVENELLQAFRTQASHLQIILNAAIAPIRQRLVELDAEIAVLIDDIAAIEIPDAAEVLLATPVVRRAGEAGQNEAIIRTRRLRERERSTQRLRSTHDRLSGRRRALTAEAAGLRQRLDSELAIARARTEALAAQVQWDLAVYQGALLRRSRDPRVEELLRDATFSRVTDAPFGGQHVTG